MSSILGRRNNNVTEVIPAPGYEQIRAADIQVDKRVQRSLSRVAVRRIVDQFDTTLLGTILVSFRSDGSYVVLDGQHRLAALKAMGLEDMMVACEVVGGLSIHEEAKLFRGRNTSRKPTIIDQFSKGLIAEDAECIGIAEILSKYGLHARSSSADTGRSSVRAIAKLQLIYRKSPQLLDQTVSVSVGAWPDDSFAFDAPILGGISLVLDGVESIDTEALTKKLKDSRPKDLLYTARSIAATSRSRTVEKLVADQIVNCYNKYRTSKRVAFVA